MVWFRGREGAKAVSNESNIALIEIVEAKGAGSARWQHLCGCRM
jgi:hypothetical protein